MKISQDAQAVIIKYNQLLDDHEFLLIYRFDKEKNKDPQLDKALEIIKNIK